MSLLLPLAPVNPASSLVAQAPLPQPQRARGLLASIVSGAYFAPTPPPDTRKVQWTKAPQPHAVIRPFMHASRQQAAAFTPLVSTPTVPSAVSESVRRPRMLPSAQQAVASPPLPPDARTVPWSASTAPEAVRRALPPVSQQRPFADPTYGWALVVAAPAITPPAWPDAVRRPAMLPAEQRADAPRVPLDRPFAQVDGYAPPAVVRPRMPAAEQQALAAPPAPPDARKVPWSDATMPAAVRRPAMLAALQQAWMDDTYALLLVVVPPITPPVYPERVRRPSFAAAQQRAFTVTTTTDRPFPYAEGIMPARLPRLVPQQRPFDGSLKPEVRLPYFGATVPATVPRPVYRPSLQQAVVNVGVPIVPVPAPDLVAACYPASVATVFRDLFPSAFSPPWTYANPFVPGGRGRARPADVILNRATAADSTGGKGTPSDE